jgi:hypothetical protein
MTVVGGLEQVGQENAAEDTYRWPEDNGGAIMQHKLTQILFNIAGVVREFRQGWDNVSEVQAQAQGSALSGKTRGEWLRQCGCTGQSGG